MGLVSQLSGRCALVLLLATCALGQQKCASVAWTTLARSGNTYGTGVWGALKAGHIDGLGGKQIFDLVDQSTVLPGLNASAAALHPSGATCKDYQAPPPWKLTPSVSASPDIPTFHTVLGKTYVVNHFEYPQPSTAYISELSAPDAAGNVRIVNTAPINDTNVKGIHFYCSGTVTPWDSHIGGEELPVDCRAYEQFYMPCLTGAAASLNYCGFNTVTYDTFGTFIEMARYWGLYPDVAKANLASLDIMFSSAAKSNLVKNFRCYNYGHVPEVKVGPRGTTNVTKWYTMGRVSHETAVVMPDRKTVYTTDDTANGVLLKFVATTAGDMRAGSLYAAKLDKQRTENGKWTFDVSWVLLGTGRQSDLEAMALSNLTFSQIFEVATPVGSPPACPAGFLISNYWDPLYMFTDKVTNKTHFIECLKVKPGMDTAAAFFETRRYASIKNATTEWDKKEGMTFSARRRKAWFTTTAIARGMTNSQQYRVGTDHISLPENRCGAVWEMDLDANWSGNKTRMLLQGEMVNPTAAVNQCHLDKISEPDNIHYVANNLLIQEDTYRHENNVMWAYNLETGNLTRILSAPRLSEVSGIYASTIGGRGYLSMGIQHPEEDLPSNTTANVDAKKAYMGYIGPINATFLSDNYTLFFEGIPVATGDNIKKVVSTTKFCYDLAKPLPANTTKSAAAADPAAAAAAGPAAADSAAAPEPVVEATPFGEPAPFVDAAAAAADGPFDGYRFLGRALRL